VVVAGIPELLKSNPEGAETVFKEGIANAFCPTDVTVLGMYKASITVALGQ